MIPWTANAYIKQHRNKVEDRFYVYVHRREDDNSIFYVGKGCGSRAWQVHGRSKYWNNIRNKHGATVEIIFDHLPESVALQVEKDTIIEFNYFGYNLCNLTTGGEGSTPSLETRLKMSKAGKGRLKSKDHRQAISAAHRGKDSSLIQGLGNPNADKTLYCFKHISGSMFNGTRWEFCSKYNLNPQTLRGLFLTKNPRTSILGWSLSILKN